MNARRTILILGVIAVVLIGAIVAIAIFFHRKMEVEKNQAKTAQARNARWQKPKEVETEVAEETPETVANEESTTIPA